jgi:non-homologous end joining protein Ku
MLDLAKHIVNQKSARFEPAKFEDPTKRRLSTSSTKRFGRRKFRNGLRLALAFVGISPQ